MIVLGIDPGLATVGFGVVRFEDGSKPGFLDTMEVLDFGVISTEAGDADADRLVEIFDGLQELMDKYKPTVMGVESLFFCNNQKTAMKVGQARGVIMLAAKKNCLKIFELTPKQVKQSISGYGMADKKQVQYMVQKLYDLDEIPKPDDAADALAICYTVGKYQCKDQ
jgi:crossover junction endodeoxyribonuclease RuvC